MAKNNKEMVDSSVDNEKDLTLESDEAAVDFLTKNKQTIKDLIAPSGINAYNLNHLEIVSSITRYARSHYVSGLPRMATFPTFLRNMYDFGDINTSVFIAPING